MADGKTDMEKAEAQAQTDRAKVSEAEEAARVAKLTPEERKAEQAAAKADTSRAQVEEMRAEQRDLNTSEPTTALEAKATTALIDPDREVSDHHVQKFANTPENPAPAPHLKDVEDDAKVKMELTDSDNPDPDRPKVAFVHPDMVGDYLRAGWRRPALQ